MPCCLCKSELLLGVGPTRRWDRAFKILLNGTSDQISGSGVVTFGWWFRLAQCYGFAMALSCRWRWSFVFQLQTSQVDEENGEGIEFGGLLRWWVGEEFWVCLWWGWRVFCFSFWSLLKERQWRCACYLFSFYPSIRGEMKRDSRQ